MSTLIQLQHFRKSVFTSLALAVLLGSASFSFAQAVLEIDEGITLEPESILGEAGDDEALSRLVDKSTISDLEFLNSGESPTSIDQLKAMQEHVASLYQRVEPAVVNIQSGMGQGSGVVVTSDGYVLTAAHVIAVPNRSATITFPDGSQAKAQTLGMFRGLDAGLLKIYRMVPEKKDEEKPEDAEEPVESESDAEESEDEKDGSESDSSEDAPEEDAPEEDESKEDESKEQEKDSETQSDEQPDEDAAKKKKKSRFEVQDDLPSFSYLEIGDSSILNLGQWVIAVGHPGGIDKDRGIVLRVGRINEIELEEEDAYVRSDCTLVGGDSGGPLIGMDGSVIGIHSRIGMRLKQNFHVPSNEFVDNWTALLDPVVHDRDARLNVSFRGNTNVIESIPKFSLAARSGLKESDRIIRIGEREIFDKLQFDDAISDLKPYQVVEFEVRRKGKKKLVDVTVGEKREMFGR